DVELAHVQGRPLPEPDLYVARLVRAGHRLLRAPDRLADNIRQQLAQAAQDLLVHAPAVRHVDQRHGGEARLTAPRRTVQACQSCGQHFAGDRRVAAVAGAADTYPRALVLAA